MIKKFLGLFSLFILVLVTFQISFALDTYVGIKILNLTDDPSHSCAGETGYGNQGRIRALSSILPDYPIYFDVTKVSDGSEVWSGNSTMDTDYSIGDTILLPQLMNLTSGEQYNLFFDIDAIRIYLPLEDYNNFLATNDDNYWFFGYYSESLSPTIEEEMQLSTHNCQFGEKRSYYTPRDSLFVFSNRSNLDYSCMLDGSAYNCGDFITLIPGKYLWHSSGNFPNEKDFNIDLKYRDLHNSTRGNFNFNFNMP